MKPAACPRGFHCGSFVPSTSMRSIDGACAGRLGAFAPSACAIGPLRWASRPASSEKASKMPKVDGPSCRANHTGVVTSRRARSRPSCRNWASCFSLPGLASRRTNNAFLITVDSCLWAVWVGLLASLVCSERGENSCASERAGAMNNALKGNSATSRRKLLIYIISWLKWPQSLGQGISSAHSVRESSDTDPLGLIREPSSPKLNAPKLTAHLPTCPIPPLSPPHPKRRPARTFHHPSCPRDQWKGAGDRPSH